MNDKLKLNLSHHIVQPLNEIVEEPDHISEYFFCSSQQKNIHTQNTLLILCNNAECKNSKYKRKSIIDRFIQTVTSSSQSYIFS